MAGIRFDCPHCNKHLGAQAGMEGKAVRCPACGQVVTTPEATTPTGAGNGPPLPTPSPSAPGPAVPRAVPAGQTKPLTTDPPPLSPAPETSLAEQSVLADVATGFHTDRLLVPGGWRLVPELASQESQLREDYERKVQPLVTRIEKTWRYMSITVGSMAGIGLILTICAFFGWAPEKYLHLAEGLAALMTITILGGLFAFGLLVKSETLPGRFGGAPKDPRDPSYDTMKWEKVFLPPDRHVEHRGHWPRRTLTALALGAGLVVSGAALAPLNQHNGGFLPDILLEVLHWALLVGFVGAAIVGTNYPYSGMFRYGAGGRYAAQNLLYARSPIRSMADLMADLAPDTGEPIPGTLLAWRVDCHLAGLPDPMDAAQFAGLCAAFEDPARPFKRWWLEASARLAREAISRTGEQHKCHECHGIGIWPHGECKRCRGKGAIRVVRQSYITRSEIIPTGRGHIHAYTRETIYDTFTCPQCKGDGHGRRVCKTCEGRGTIGYTPKDIYFVEMRSRLRKEAEAAFPCPA